MKRFLPLFIFTGLLFGQDVLLHKSGEVYKGTYIGKVDEDIVFKIEGRSSTNNFPINDVDIVITSRGGIKVELYYPFDIPIDIPTKKENPSLIGNGVKWLSPSTWNTISSSTFLT